MRPLGRTRMGLLGLALTVSWAACCRSCSLGASPGCLFDDCSSGSTGSSSSGGELCQASQSPTAVSYGAFSGGTEWVGLIYRSQRGAIVEDAMEQLDGGGQRSLLVACSLLPGVVRATLTPEAPSPEDAGGDGGASPWTVPSSLCGGVLDDGDAGDMQITFNFPSNQCRCEVDPTDMNVMVAAEELSPAFDSSLPPFGCAPELLDLSQVSIPGGEPPYPFLGLPVLLGIDGGIALLPFSLGVADGGASAAGVLADFLPAPVVKALAGPARVLGFGETVVIESGGGETLLLSPASRQAAGLINALCLDAGAPVAALACDFETACDQPCSAGQTMPTGATCCYLSQRVLPPELGVAFSIYDEDTSPAASFTPPPAGFEVEAWPGAPDASYLVGLVPFGIDGGASASFAFEAWP